MNEANWPQRPSSSRSGLGFGERWVGAVFICCRFGLIFTVLTSLKEGAPQVKGEEPQTVPLAYILITFSYYQLGYHRTGHLIV